MSISLETLEAEVLKLPLGSRELKPVGTKKTRGVVVLDNTGTC